MISGLAKIFEVFVRIMDYRIGKDNSRKDAKQAKFGGIRKTFFFAPWRLDAKIFIEVILLNILSLRI